VFKKTKKDSEERKSKVLDVDADMQGRLVFRDPVDLRINGKFEGSLDTKGNLVIGEEAVVNAEIMGENITVSGKVVGDIKAKKRLAVTEGAQIIGDIVTPILKVEEGAYLQGTCQMITQGQKAGDAKIQTLNRQQLAEYLEVDLNTVDDWIQSRKIPAFKESSEWKFDKSKIDAWVATEKIK